MAEVTQELQAHQVQQRQIESVTSSLRNMSMQLETLEKNFAKEEKDVEKLKSMTFTNFLHTLLNDKPETIQKEELEAMAAKEKLDQLVALMEAEKANLNTLNSHLKDGGKLKASYDEILDEKTQVIKKSMPEIWSKILISYAEIDDIKMGLVEMEEAIDAGGKAILHVEKIKKSLSSAEGWGTYDMLGGGMLATMAKHSHMEEAQREMHAFQSSLKTFSRELQDVGDSINFSLDMDGFLSFADYFFDGLFVDWAVQNKIQNAKNQINGLEVRIKQIIERLRSQHRASKMLMITKEQELIKAIEAV